MRRWLVVGLMIPNLVAWIWAGWLTVEVAQEDYTWFQSIPQGLALLGVVIVVSVAIIWLAMLLWKAMSTRLAVLYGVACIVLWAASLTLGFVTSRLAY